MRSGHHVRQIIVGGLAFVGTLYLGFHVLAWTFFSDETAPSNADMAGSILSPDGQYKAVIFFWGGPPGVGVQERVGIIPSDRSDTTAWADSNLIFRSSCGALGETLEDMRKAVTWKSAEALELTFRSDGQGCVINLKDYAGERAAIRIRFVSSSR